MERPLYEVFPLVGEVSEISLVRCTHSFDFRYYTNSCENPARAVHETLLTARNSLLHLDGPPVEESHNHEFLVVDPE